MKHFCKFAKYFIMNTYFSDNRSATEDPILLTYDEILLYLPFLKPNLYARILEIHQIRVIFRKRRSD